MRAALIVRPRARPIGMQVQLHLLPRLADIADQAAERLQPEQQRRHRIDEETRLQPISRQLAELIADAYTGGLDRTFEQRQHFKPGGVMTPGDLGVHGQENWGHAPGLGTEGEDFPNVGGLDFYLAPSPSGERLGRGSSVSKRPAPNFAGTAPPQPRP